MTQKRKKVKGSHVHEKKSREGHSKRSTLPPSIYPHTCTSWSWVYDLFFHESTHASHIIHVGWKKEGSTGVIHNFDEQLSTLPISEENEPSRIEYSSTTTSLFVDLSRGIFTCSEAPLVLKNKPPRRNGQLQCWCLNFRGRGTIRTSNFSHMSVLLMAYAEQEKVVL